MYSDGMSMNSLTEVRKERSSLSALWEQRPACERGRGGGERSAGLTSCPVGTRRGELGAPAPERLQLIEMWGLLTFLPPPRSFLLSPSPFLAEEQTKEGSLPGKKPPGQSSLLFLETLGIKSCGKMHMS